MNDVNWDNKMVWKMLLAIVSFAFAVGCQGGRSGGASIHAVGARDGLTDGTQAAQPMDLGKTVANNGTVTNPKGPGRDLFTDSRMRYQSFHSPDQTGFEQNGYHYMVGSPDGEEFLAKDIYPTPQNLMLAESIESAGVNVNPSQIELNLHLVPISGMPQSKLTLQGPIPADGRLATMHVIADPGVTLPEIDQRTSATYSCSGVDCAKADIALARPVFIYGRYRSSFIKIVYVRRPAHIHLFFVSGDIRKYKDQEFKYAAQLMKNIALQGTRKQDPDSPYLSPIRYYADRLNRISLETLTIANGRSFFRANLRYVFQDYRHTIRTPYHTVVHISGPLVAPPKSEPILLYKTLRYTETHYPNETQYTLPPTTLVSLMGVRADGDISLEFQSQVCPLILNWKKLSPCKPGPDYFKADIVPFSPK